MKVYISVDMEGLAFVNDWDEVEKSKEDFIFFAQEMKKEVLAACKAINEIDNKSEIYIRDAHWTARNLNLEDLPDNVKLIRGWGESPESMVEFIDDSFDCAVFIGYHIGGHSGKNPISHTISENVRYIKINGQFVSEFDIYGLAASYFNVPVVFVSGDEALINHINNKYPNIETLATIRGKGDATICLLNSKQTCDLINKKLKVRLERKQFEKMNIPEKICMEISFQKHKVAYAMSYYPNVKKIDDFTISFESNDYYEVLRFKFFAMKLLDI